MKRLRLFAWAPLSQLMLLAFASAPVMARSQMVIQVRTQGSSTIDAVAFQFQRHSICLNAASNFLANQPLNTVTSVSCIDLTNGRVSTETLHKKLQ